MATVPPAGGAVAAPGSAAPNTTLQHSSTLINGRAMATDHLQRRRIKARVVNSFMAFRCKYMKVLFLMHYR
jgi:hypothetical protein